eukprot:XP_001704904.1 Hypothetical protein GL50803_32594 [Giardia lamblia ATCC 50803]
MTHKETFVRQQDALDVLKVIFSITVAASTSARTALEV